MRPFAPRHSKARIEALASLLADESEFVWAEVRREFERAGRAGRPALARAARGESPLARGRARALLLAQDKKPALRRLVGYLSGASAGEGGIDLEKSFFLLARWSDPRLDVRPFVRQLDELGRVVAARARGRIDPLQKARVLVEVLGTELEFGGTKTEFHHPDNIHLHRVLERRSGMPLALCAIYLFVARRAGIRASCVPLPGHVMLRLHGAQTNTIVDPYHKGQTRTERDCRKYLEQSGLQVKAAWFRDADARTLLKRHVSNLARSAQLRGVSAERRDLALLAGLLEPRAAASAPTRER